MFDVRTPKRIYYLAADTEDEMMKWVHNVCHVCGLKAYTPEEDGGYLANEIWIAFLMILTTILFLFLYLNK